MPEDDKQSPEVLKHWLDWLIILLILMAFINFLPDIASYLKDKIFSDGFEYSYSNHFNIPPEGKNEEKSLLGSLITGRANMEDVKNKLSPSSFLDPKHRIIYEAMKALDDAGERITFLSLRDKLAEEGLLEYIGGEDYLRQMVRLASDTESMTATSILKKINGGILFFLKILALISIFGISYILIRFMGLRKQQLIDFAKVPTAPDSYNESNWDKIIAMSESENSSERKFAIIEADTILDEIVTKMGYSGDGLGEKLKNVEISDFNTLEDAWEAHKFRNRIAHQNESVTKKEAKRIISLYEKVFKEFEYL